MKKMIIISSIMGLFVAITFLFANLVWPQASTTFFSQANWLSKNSSDPFTIQNGAGTPIVIQINVGGSSPNSSGVNVKNCGNTSHINPGSSTICSTNEDNNPVTLTSDSNYPAYGTYQIKQK